MGRCADKCVGDREDCEDEIKERSKGRSDGDEPEDAKAPSMGAKSLCIPFEQPEGEHALVSGKTKCTQCGLDAKVCPVVFLPHRMCTYCVGISTTRSLEDPISRRALSDSVSLFFGKNCGWVFFCGLVGSGRISFICFPVPKWGPLSMYTGNAI